VALYEYQSEEHHNTSDTTVMGARINGVIIRTNEETACWIACADQLVLDSKLSRAPPDLGAYYSRALDASRGVIKGRHVGDEIAAHARPYIETILRWVKKRPFRTQGGYVGLAPGEARAGDIVVILPGFSEPYVLRNVRGKERAYEVVGECYVCGVMDSEYLGAVETVQDLYHLV